jgi:hypothetical protein
MDIVEGLVVIVALSVALGLPLFALTLRFAVKPLVVAYLEVTRPAPPATAEVEELRARVAALEALLEQQLSPNPFEMPAFSSPAPRRPMS